MATNDERRAMHLYIVLARDWSDFLDMLPEASVGELEVLLRILEVPPGPQTDGELNAIGAKCVKHEMGKRAPTPLLGG
jgi:hypothetical protein